MSVKVSLRQLKDRLAELVDEVDKTGEEYVVQRNGKDCAVLVSARQWRLRTVGRNLDNLGRGFRLSAAKQSRAEVLLAAKNERILTATERAELKVLLRESETIMRRRAAALDRMK